MTKNKYSALKLSLKTTASEIINDLDESSNEKLNTNEKKFIHDVMMCDNVDELDDLEFLKSYHSILFIKSVLHHNFNIANHLLSYNMFKCFSLSNFKTVLEYCLENKNSEALSYFISVIFTTSNDDFNIDTEENIFYDDVEENNSLVQKVFNFSQKQMMIKKSTEIKKITKNFLLLKPVVDFVYETFPATVDLLLNSRDYYKNNSKYILEKIISKKIYNNVDHNIIEHIIRSIFFIVNKTDNILVKIHDIKVIDMLFKHVKYNLNTHIVIKLFINIQGDDDKTIICKNSLIMHDFFDPNYNDGELFINLIREKRITDIRNVYDFHLSTINNKYLTLIMNEIFVGDPIFKNKIYNCQKNNDANYVSYFLFACKYNDKIMVINVLNKKIIDTETIIEGLNYSVNNKHDEIVSIILNYDLYDIETIIPISNILSQEYKKSPDRMCEIFSYFKSKEIMINNLIKCNDNCEYILYLLNNDTFVINYSLFFKNCIKYDNQNYDETINKIVEFVTEKNMKFDINDYKYPVLRKKYKLCTILKAAFPELLNYQYNYEIEYCENNDVDTLEFIYRLIDEEYEEICGVTHDKKLKK